jgi:hypothetical protein
MNGTGDIHESTIDFNPVAMNGSYKGVYQWKLLPNGHLSISYENRDPSDKTQSLLTFELQRK